MTATSMAVGWYVLKQGAAAGQQAGPYTWAQLFDLARSGAVQPDDLVWNANTPDWLQAAQIPGLFAGAATPASQASAQVPQQPSSAGQPRRSWLLPVLIRVVALIIVGGGLGAFFALHGTGKSGDNSEAFGQAGRVGLDDQAG